MWKALKYAPNELAYLCVDPVSHVLLWQRACFIVEHKDYLLKRMLEDDNYYDVKLAAYWLYIKSTEIGVLDLEKVDTKKIFSGVDNGLSAGRPQLIGLNGIHSSYQKNGHKDKQKVERLKSWFKELQSVLENARLVCGDWKRLFNENAKWQDDCGKKNVGIFFDPPYGDTNRKLSLYRLDSFSVAKEVNDFCVKHASKISDLHVRFCSTHIL